ncbi:helix-turn-helix domain-containing protein [Romboutsia sp.]|uniref:helix-turn-helix domain-containing protein n=1 Tax=Romboutsia sp. TaxID=1965302 RepID=UPI003F2DA6CF
MSFGDKLKQLRNERMVTQQELADFIGIGRASIAGYETREKHPDFEKLKRIATYFNVTTDYLLDYERDSSNDDETTVINNKIDIYEGLPEEAKYELHEYINYLKFKYKDNF